MSNPHINAIETSGILQTSAGPTLVKRAFDTEATAATHTLVAGVTGKKIRVLGFYVTAASAVNVQFKSASTNIAANLAIEGAMSSYCPHGWFETAAGEALSFALSAAVSTSVQVVYVEVD